MHDATVHSCCLAFSYNDFRIDSYVMAQVCGEVCHGLVANVMFITRRERAVSFTFMLALKQG